MSERVVEAPFAPRFELSSLWGVFEWVQRAVATAFVSEREKRFLRWIQPTCDAIGEELLAACDRADFDDRLETVVERPDLHRLNLQILCDSELRALTETARPDAARTDWPVDLLGGGAVAHLRRADQFLIAIMAARSTLLELYPMLKDALAPSETDDPLEFVGDPRIHPEIKDALLDGIRADHCAAAILHVMIHRRAPPRWLSLVLAEKVAEGYYHYLRFFASIPGLDVPLTTVPASDRYNLAMLHREMVKTESWLHQFATCDGDSTVPFSPDDTCVRTPGRNPTARAS